MDNSQNYLILGILSFILFIIGGLTQTAILFQISALAMVIFIVLWLTSKNWGNKI